MSRAIGYAVAGLGYGAVLFGCAVVCAGAGHGSYLPFAVFGAPLSFVPMAGLLGAPLLWALFGLLLGHTTRRDIPIALLLTHLAGVCVALLFGNALESGEQQWVSVTKAIEFVPGALWGGVAIYVGGQVASWTLALRSRDRAPDH